MVVLTLISANLFFLPRIERWSDLNLVYEVLDSVKLDNNIYYCGSEGVLTFNNLNATNNILSAIVEAKQDVHVVHLGSMGVYGYSSVGLQKSYVVNNVLEDFTSKVGQHIEILDLEQFGKSLFIDNEIQVATSDEHLYSSTFVNSGLKLNSKKDKAAIIGGGDGGVARECISQSFGFIDWYELDPEVVDVCNKHLGSIGNLGLEQIREKMNRLR